MPRLDGPEISRHHMTLYKEDYELLKVLFKGRVGISKAVRDIVHKSLRTLHEKANRSTHNTELPEDIVVEDIDIDSIE